MISRSVTKMHIRWRRLIARTVGAILLGMVILSTVGQQNKAFHPHHIRLSAGTILKIRNDDIRAHNLRIHDPGLDYNSGAQEPGETAEITFPQPGTYYIFCGIHPKMKLMVEVP